MNDVRGKKIFVGLSGGVDSAISAALLQRAGASVTGVFIKGWYPEGMPCTWGEERRDAMRIAAHLQIPFHTLDASEAYKKGVIEYLVAEYGAGRTPNPDIMCNREVKFGAFHTFAEEHHALLATGHYAQIKEGQLLRGIDASKDQSYFLWAVPKGVLEKTRFPVGSMHKDKVRNLAKRLHVPVAQKKDSQGICFLGSVSVEDFLMREFGSEEGKAVDEAGNEVGSHTGVLLHTIGERIALHRAAPGPWYVRRKLLSENTLVVGRTHEVPTTVSAIRLGEQNWLSEGSPGESLEAQYRYHGSLVAGHLSDDRTRFRPAGPLPEPIALGQSLVLYRGEELVGGGIVVE